MYDTMTKESLKEKYGDVSVWVIKDELIAEYLNGTFTDRFVTAPVDKWVITPLRTFIRNNMEPMLRYEAELDPKYKQIITYAIIQERESGDVFCTKRLGGDSRLVGQYSIGIGGHVEPPEQIYDALYREIEEEVGLSGTDLENCTFKGYIYDNSSEVSSVHVGFAFLVSVSKKAISVKEKDKLSGEWVSLAQLKKYRTKDKLETWSAIAADNILFGGVN